MKNGQMEPKVRDDGLADMAYCAIHWDDACLVVANIKISSCLNRCEYRYDSFPGFRVFDEKMDSKIT